MRILILGSTGMLGHKLYQVAQERFDAYATAHRDFGNSPASSIIVPTKLIQHVDANDTDSVRRALDAVRPDVVVNCIGIVKQREAAHNPIASIIINSLFPHQLA